MTFNFVYDAPDAQAAPQIFTWLVKCHDAVGFGTLQEGVATALFEDLWGGDTWKKLKVGRIRLFVLRPGPNLEVMTGYRRTKRRTRRVLTSRRTLGWTIR